MGSMMDGRAPREIALTVLDRVDRTDSFAKEVLEGRLRRSRLSSKDRGLARELTYGTLRWRGYIDGALRSLLYRDLDALPAMIRNILRMGAYQILFLDRIPDFAAVDQSVSLAKKYGHGGTAGLVNAVLRQVAARRGEMPLFPDGADRIERLAIEYSHPRWLVERWLERWGEETTRGLCAAANRTPPFVVRVNSTRTDPDSLRTELRSAGIESERGRYLPEALRLAGPVDLRRLEAFRRGLFVVQDESAMAVTALLDPRPGEVIVDLCSAPGGKATHIAERTGSSAYVVAVDRHQSRLRLVRQNAERLGLERVVTVVGDGAAFCARGVDRVLVDAPCSGTGVLRRRVDLRWRLMPSDIGALVRRQTALLEGASRLVRNGGVMVYSTCTLEPEENEEVVEGFLGRHGGFQREDATSCVHRDLVDETGYLRTFPSLHDLDGTFAARLRKVGGGEEIGRAPTDRG
jgi:16S rRNA (cytosine967-C5)-methyltransferase